LKIGNKNVTRIRFFEPISYLIAYGRRGIYVLARAALAAKNATAKAAFAVAVRTAKAAVNANFIKPFSVFFSEIRAQIAVKHNAHLPSFSLIVSLFALI
jgi:hypothetical protein